MPINHWAVLCVQRQCYRTTARRTCFKLICQEQWWILLKPFMPLCSAAPSKSRTVCSDWSEPGWTSEPQHQLHSLPLATKEREELNRRGRVPTDPLMVLSWDLDHSQEQGQAAHNSQKLLNQIVMEGTLLHTLLSSAVARGFYHIEFHYLTDETLSVYSLS